MSILSSTRSLLTAWGRWGGVRIGTELPSCVPFYTYRIRSSGPDEPDPEILRCEQAVCKVDPIERQLLIMRYQRLYHPWKIAKEYDISTRSAYRELERAEWAVHVELGR